MASFLYNIAKTNIPKADMDLETADIRAMLVDSVYVPDADHVNVDDGAAANELSGTGYERKTLASKAVAQDDANDRAAFDAADLTWTGLDAGTAAAVVLFQHVTNDADSILLAYIDSGFPFVSNGGDFVIQWNANGIILLT